MGPENSTYDATIENFKDTTLEPTPHQSGLRGHVASPSTLSAVRRTSQPPPEETHFLALSDYEKGKKELARKMQ
jgi:hypothetical protein